MRRTAFTYKYSRLVSTTDRWENLREVYQRTLCFLPYLWWGSFNLAFGRARELGILQVENVDPILD